MRLPQHGDKKNGCLKNGKLIAKLIIIDTSNGNLLKTCLAPESHFDICNKKSSAWIILRTQRTQPQTAGRSGNGFPTEEEHKQGCQMVLYPELFAFFVFINNYHRWKDK